jgi:Peptidase family S64
MQTSFSRTRVPPSEDVEDPLSPRPESYSEGFYGTPQIKYFTKPDFPADREFERVLKTPIIEYLEKKKYSSFCVLMCHAGYEKSTSVPVVVVCAADMPDDEALELTDIFNNVPGRALVQRCFIYDGISRHLLMESQLRKHEAKPTPGASIGVRGGNSAFSLGVYFQLSADDNLYCTTVHHGVANLPRITPDSTPRIIVEQPSCVDIESEINDSLEELICALDSQGIRRYANVKDLYNHLYDLLDLEVEFGEIVASEFDIIDYEERRINSDVAIIRVLPSRNGCNRIIFPFAWSSSKTEWVPRDYTGIYVSGVDHIRDGTIVVKSGRASGTTEGRISFRYAYVNLEGTGITTSEYCVVSETPRNLFCEQGDSGAPVVDKNGSVVGTILGGTYGKPKKLIGYESLGDVYAGYITPMDMILDRIKAITGKDATIVIADLDEVEKSGLKLIRKV